MSGATAAERLLMQLGISKAEDIDLDAIAWHLGAAVKYRHMDNADATIVGSSKRAIIAINSSIDCVAGSAFRSRMNWVIGITIAAEFFFAVLPISATLPAARSILSDKPTRLRPTSFSPAISCVPR